MWKLMGGLFSSVQFYIYIVFLSIIGTLWVMNAGHVHTIEKQSKELVLVEQAKIRLERSLQSQNERVMALKAEGEKLRDRVVAGTAVITAMDQDGEKVVLMLDQETIPEECSGAMMWMIQKSMEELEK